MRLWDFLFYASFGFVVTSSVAIAGVLLVFCYLIVPSVAAMLYSDHIGRRLAIGWTMGTVVSALGIYLSVQPRPAHGGDHGVHVRPRAGPDGARAAPPRPGRVESGRRAALSRHPPLARRGRRAAPTPSAAAPASTAWSQAYWQPVYAYLRLRWRARRPRTRGPHPGLLRARAGEGLLRRVRPRARPLPDLPARLPRRLRLQRAGAPERRLKRGGGTPRSPWTSPAPSATCPAARPRARIRTPSSIANGCGAVCADAVALTAAAVPRERPRAGARRSSSAATSPTSPMPTGRATPRSPRSSRCRLTQVTNLLAAARREFRARRSRDAPARARPATRSSRTRRAASSGERG